MEQNNNENRILRLLRFNIGINFVFGAAVSVLLVIAIYSYRKFITVIPYNHSSGITQKHAGNVSGTDETFNSETSSDNSGKKILFRSEKTDDTEKNAESEENVAVSESRIENSSGYHNETGNKKGVSVPETDDSEKRFLGESGHFMHLSESGRIRLAMIYRFAQHTEWPEDAFEDDTSPIILFLYNRNNISEKAVERLSVRGRKVELRFYDGESGSEKIHIFFFNSGGSDSYEHVLKNIKTSPVLTIGEHEDFIKSGGIIRFQRVENNIRYEINSDAAVRAGLKIDQKIIESALENI